MDTLLVMERMERASRIQTIQDTLYSGDYPAAKSAIPLFFDFIFMTDCILIGMSSVIAL